MMHIDRSFQGLRDLYYYSGSTLAEKSMSDSGYSDSNATVTASQLTPSKETSSYSPWNFFSSSLSPKKQPEEEERLYDLVLGCVEDSSLSRDIAEAARLLRIPVNCADVPDLCDFYFVANYRSGPVQIGVSTNGCGPKMAARIRDEIRNALPKETGDAVQAVGRLRARVRTLDPEAASAPRRMPWLSKFCDQWTMKELAEMKEEDVIAALRAYERGDPPPSRPPSSLQSVESSSYPSSLSSISPTQQQNETPPPARTNPVSRLTAPFHASINLASSAASRTLSLFKSAVCAPYNITASVALTTRTISTSMASKTLRVASDAAATCVNVVDSALDLTNAYARSMRETAESVEEGMRLARTLNKPLQTATPVVAPSIDTAKSTSVPTGTATTALLSSPATPVPLFQHGVLSAPESTPSTTTSSSSVSPTLYLVGGGPGDPGLLTLRAFQLLSTAQVIVSDQLISAELLAVVPKTAKLVFVERKVKGRSDIAQADANRVCVEELCRLRDAGVNPTTTTAAGRGGIVVRLKGGDSFLFGRGAEEALFVREAGFRVVVVPGVTSCIAAPASVGIPVTHRGVSDQLLVLSARGESGAFPEIPKFSAKRTLVVLMPIARMSVLVDQMVSDCGFPLTTPAAVVEKGTCVGERVVEGTLADIADKVVEGLISSPALLVVGNVCSVLRRSALL